MPDAFRMALVFRQGILAKQHVSIAQSQKWDSSSGCGGNGPVPAFRPRRQSGHLAENVESAAGGHQAIDALGFQPFRPITIHRAPGCIRGAPGGLQLGQRPRATAPIFGNIVDPDVHVKCQQRQVPQHEIHAADQQEIYLLLAQYVQYPVNVHDARMVPALTIVKSEGRRRMEPNAKAPAGDAGRGEGNGFPEPLCLSYTSPWSSMASATLTKPAMLAPTT